MDSYWDKLTPRTYGTRLLSTGATSYTYAYDRFAMSAKTSLAKQFGRELKRAE